MIGFAGVFYAYYDYKEPVGDLCGDMFANLFTIIF